MEFIGDIVSNLVQVFLKGDRLGKRGSHSSCPQYHTSQFGTQKDWPEGDRFSHWLVLSEIGTASPVQGKVEIITYPPIHELEMLDTKHTKKC